MQVFNTIEAYREWRNKQSQAIGFVPTMGALHKGHAELLHHSKIENALTVLSIFVNPTQFGPNEDLSKYPRTLEADLEIAKSAGVDAVFVPTPEILYPPEYSTYVVEENISAPLCGKFRPGHFRGVTTIVLKLFNIIQPTSAYFGLKDAQQYFVIDRMVRDMNLQIKIVGVPTVRESTGLALSSRNTFLSKEDRETVAPKFFEILTQTKKSIGAGENVSATLERGRASLAKAGFEVQYLELQSFAGKSILAGAVFLKGASGSPVRLIDNIID